MDTGSVYLLSNNHVLAANVGPIGTRIYQPGVEDGGNIFSTIAYLSAYEEIKYETMYEQPDNYIDVAIARVGSLAFQTPIKLFLLKKGLITNQSIPGTTTVNIGDRVRKVGKVSETTCGMVTEVNASVEILSSGGSAYFVEQILTTPMSQPGDSGSIGTKDGNAFGLLMGGQVGTRTIYNRIQTVLSTLNINIWNY